MNNYGRASVLASLVCLMMTSGCMTAGQHSQSLHSSQDREFTLGVVQARITKGMSQAEVAESLGSPNIVTKDRDDDETWVYDKIATEASYSTDSGSVGGLAGAGGAPASALILGGLFGNYNKSAGASAVSQKTLTVVIKFDRGRRVKDFSYHSSKF